MNKSMAEVVMWSFSFFNSTVNEAPIYLLGYLWELRGCDGSGNDGSLWLGAIAALLHFFHSDWEQINQYYRFTLALMSQSKCLWRGCLSALWPHSAVASAQLICWYNVHK